jgi:hypothetical protein
MNDTHISPKLDLSRAIPIFGLEFERNESYSTAIDIGGIRTGLFFEPANSFCNSGAQARVKVWAISDDTMAYFEITRILGLKVFWENLLALTDVSTRQKAKSSFGEIIYLG